jgi:flagellar biogenesis protein FliO
MTPLRQAFHAALAIAGLCVASPTFAEPLAPIGPPTAEEAAASASAEATAAAAAAAPVAAPAPAKQPSWLASRPQPKVAAAGRSSLPSTGRMFGLLLVLGSLGGAALYLKRRGRGEDKRVALPKRLSVLSSTRIGPKAHAVVISVAGRQMLLGVTDSSVKRLAFIDELEEEDTEREREPARRAAIQSAVRSAALAVRAAAPEPSRAGSFADILKTAFGKRSHAEPADAASVLAAETQDTVGGKPVVSSVSNVRMIDVEGQAQGLVRRLSGPRA